ncbi:MAG: hypothetical protein GWO41_12920 [candidate division Zixibacteria bacterium]|nr:hypothetical protein [candidate division Zixibacteria bacterium]NIS17246.1 hypothetical protein [candidate division Zixibacteria bacterium]NIS47789.1 hypothetical protein [candidate division Zixibacteria bacterium]NIT53603.1 hypothetical protein [candidate division Zixibacteria bacterium]NIU15895.1 hypothetical protein [candidate division Zixibacteria bacterium]
MKKAHYRIGMLIFILGGGALLAGIYHYDLIRIEAVDCRADHGEFSIPVDDYVKEHIGTSILDYPSASYVDTILFRYPQVSRASVNLNPSGKVVFDYDLKQPIALISLDIVYGLTARGELVPAQEGDLPIITGLKIKHVKLYEQLDESKIGYALKLANLLNSNITGIENAVSSVNLAHPSGLSAHVKGCRSEFILGRGDELKKFRKLGEYLEFFCALGNNIRAVDFRFENQLILKKDQ